MKYPRTPDGRYFVHGTTLWRCTNPNLPEADRVRWVRSLMDARRAVKSAKASGEDAAMKAARAAVHEAKVALGERGPTWWDDDTDYNRRKITGTPYAGWWATREAERVDDKAADDEN